MGSGKINLPPLAMLVVIVLQFIMIQVVTFFVSLLFPSLGDYPTTLPALFLYLIGLLFTVGIYLTGWVAIKGGALKIERKYLARMAWTLLGTYLPLVIAYIISHPLQPGNPLFFVSMVTGILGFYIPGWSRKMVNQT